MSTSLTTLPTVTIPSSASRRSRSRRSTPRRYRATPNNWLSIVLRRIRARQTSTSLTGTVIDRSLTAPTVLPNGGPIRASTTDTGTIVLPGIAGLRRRQATAPTVAAPAPVPAITAEPELQADARLFLSTNQLGTLLGGFDEFLPERPTRLKMAFEKAKTDAPDTGVWLPIRVEHKSQLTMNLIVRSGDWNNGWVTDIKFYACGELLSNLLEVAEYMAKASRRSPSIPRVSFVNRHSLRMAA